jgi:hypothetical protein
MPVTGPLNTGVNAPVQASLLAPEGPPGEAGAAGQPCEPSAARVRTLAGVLAGYRWPGRAGRLRKGQQAAAEAAARVALQQLAGEPD